MEGLRKDVANFEAMRKRQKVEPVRQTPVPTLQTLAWRALPDNVTVPEIVNRDVLSRSRETLIPESTRPPPISLPAFHEPTPPFMNSNVRRHVDGLKWGDQNYQYDTPDETVETFVDRYPSSHWYLGLI